MPDGPSDLFIEVMVGVTGWPVWSMVLDGFTELATWPCIFGGFMMATAHAVALWGVTSRP